MKNMRVLFFLTALKDKNEKKSLRKIGANYCTVRFEYQTFNVSDGWSIPRIR